MTLPDLYIKLSKIMMEISQAYREANLGPDLPNLTFKQYYYLDNIYRMDNPTYSEIAEKLRVTKPAVTSIVNKLIEMGYLERVQSATDRRNYHITVSQKGKRLAEINDQSAYAYAKYVEDCLANSELQEYTCLLEKIVAKYDSRKTE